MEISNSDCQPVLEQQRDRVARAELYLERAAAVIVEPGWPDYVKDVGCYYFSLIAVAQETGRPVDKRNIVDISRTALERTDFAHHDRAEAIQADMAERIEDIKRLAFAHIELANKRVDPNKPDTYLEILDMLAAGELVYNPRHNRNLS